VRAHLLEMTGDAGAARDAYCAAARRAPNLRQRQAGGSDRRRRRAFEVTDWGRDRALRSRALLELAE
jgi:hypothetical protein